MKQFSRPEVFPMDESTLTRRGSLFRMGGLLAGVLGAAGLKIESSEGAGPAAVASGALSCVLTPEQTEGPYYISGEKLRRDITEGRAGAAMLLRAFVVNASTCKPIKGAAVDIWHADAGGVYSGFGQGAANRTFMRGIQKTNAKGLALFRTVYPGWYQGRTVHIHVKVHLGGNVVHTGQLYFPDAVTDTVYRGAPYSARPNRTTRNADDSIYRNGGSKSLVSVRKNAAGVYVATIMMGVHRS
jgi:protocatechuate 3,4-dioxygenase beta subunit